MAEAKSKSNSNTSGKMVLGTDGVDPFTDTEEHDDGEVSVTIQHRMVASWILKIWMLSLMEDSNQS